MQAEHPPDSCPVMETPPRGLTSSKAFAQFDKDHKDHNLVVLNSLSVLVGHANITAVVSASESYAVYLAEGQSIKDTSLYTAIVMEARNIAKQFALLCRDSLDMVELHQEYLTRRNELFLGEALSPSKKPSAEMFQESGAHHDGGDGDDDVQTVIAAEREQEADVAADASPSKRRQAKYMKQFDERKPVVRRPFIAAAVLSKWSLWDIDASSPDHMASRPKASFLGVLSNGQSTSASSVDDFKADFGGFYKQVRDSHHARSRRLAGVRDVSIVDEQGNLHAEPPIALQTDEICSGVLTYLAHRGMDYPVFRRFFSSSEGRRSVDRLFWCIHCKFFVPDSFTQQADLLFVFSEIYTRFFETLQRSEQDQFVDYVPYVYAFAVCRLFRLSFPHSIHCFPELWEFAVYRLCIFLICGRFERLSGIYRLRFALFREERPPHHVLRVLAQLQTKRLFMDLVHQIIRPYPTEMPHPYTFVEDILRFSDYDMHEAYDGHDVRAEAEKNSSVNVPRRHFRSASEEDLFFLGFLPDPKDRTKFHRTAPMIRSDPGVPFLYCTDGEKGKVDIQMVTDKVRVFLNSDFHDMPRLRCSLVDRADKAVAGMTRAPIVQFYLSQKHMRELRTMREEHRSRSALMVRDQHSAFLDESEDSESEAFETKIMSVLFEGTGDKERLFLTQLLDKEREEEQGGSNSDSMASTVVLSPFRQGKVLLQCMESLDVVFGDKCPLRRLLSQPTEDLLMALPNVPRNPSYGSKSRSTSPTFAASVVRGSLTTEPVHRVKTKADLSRDMFVGYKTTFKTAIEEMRQADRDALRMHKNIYDRHLKRVKEDRDAVRTTAAEYTAQRALRTEKEERLLAKLTHNTMLPKATKESTKGPSRPGSPDGSVDSDDESQALRAIRLERRKRKEFRKNMDAKLHAFVFEGTRPDPDKFHLHLVKVKREIQSNLNSDVRRHVHGHLSADGL